MALVYYTIPSGYFILPNFVHPQVLNIFADASIEPVGHGKFNSCYGAEAYCGELLIDSEYRVCKDTTVNDSEIKGIRTAVSMAIKHRGEYPIINIFSDSQISVYGIRDRILKWDIYKDELVGSRHKPISNQSIYIEIMRMIVDYQLYVNIYHQKGHVHSEGYNSMVNAADVFSTSNNVLGPIDMDFITYISKKNASIDNNTRTILKEYTGEKCTDALYFGVNQFYQYRKQYKDIRRAQNDLQRPKGK